MLIFFQCLNRCWENAYQWLQHRQFCCCFSWWSCWSFAGISPFTSNGWCNNVSRAVFPGDRSVGRWWVRGELTRRPPGKPWQNGQKFTARWRAFSTAPSTPSSCPTWSPSGARWSTRRLLADRCIIVRKSTLDRVLGSRRGKCGSVTGSWWCRRCGFLVIVSF